MSRWQVWLFHVSTTAVSLSGVVYLWMKYFMSTDDPFSLVNHPLQPAMLGAHIVAAPFLILAVGMMAESHILRKMANGNGKSRSNLRSGLVALFVFPVMALSGYALQVLTDAKLVQAALVLHLATGFLFMGSYAVHQVTSVMLVRRMSRPKAVECGDLSPISRSSAVGGRGGA